LEDAMEGFPKYWLIHTSWNPATREGNNASLSANTHTHTYTNTPIDLYMCVSVPFSLAACYNLLKSVTCGMSQSVTFLRMSESVYRCMIQLSLINHRCLLYKKL
jgi:hypothetical protein